MPAFPLIRSLILHLNRRSLDWDFMLLPHQIVRKKPGIVMGWRPGVGLKAESNTPKGGGNRLAGS